MSYKVLWIDDKYFDPTFESFKLSAKIFGIELIGEKYHLQGMEILKNDSSFEYQAVILDVFGFKKSDIEENTLSNLGLNHSLKELNELMSSRLIPWFVFTGEPKYTDNEDLKNTILTYQEDIKFGRSDLCYYIKGSHDEELLQDIKLEIDKQQQTQIQYQHKRVFQIAKKLNIPNEDINHLVTIIKSIQSNKIDLEPSLYFTQLRKYVEYVFRDAAKYNILHEKCIDKDGKVNLTDSSLFLAGVSTKHSKPNRVSCTKTHFSKIMAENIKNLLFITGTASHTSDVDPAKNMDYQTYREQIKTPYLLYQLTFTIFDLLIWYENLINQNPDPEENKKLWVEITEESEEHNWVEGELKSVNDAGYGTFQPSDDSKAINIRPTDIAEHNLIVGDFLKVVPKPSADGKKTHIKHIKKINKE